VLEVSGKSSFKTPRLVGQCRARRKKKSGKRSTQRCGHIKSYLGRAEGRYALHCKKQFRGSLREKCVGKRGRKSTEGVTTAGLRLRGVSVRTGTRIKRSLWEGQPSRDCRGSQGWQDKIETKSAPIGREKKKTPLATGQKRGNTNYRVLEGSKESSGTGLFKTKKLGRHETLTSGNLLPPKGEDPS